MIGVPLDGDPSEIKIASNDGPSRSSGCLSQGRGQLLINAGRLVATAAAPLIVNDRAGNPTTKMPTLGADVSVSGMFMAAHDRRSGLTTVQFSMTSIKPGKAA